MFFDWDPDKRRINLAEHGIDFEAAKRIFEGPVLERVDDREDYGEMRVAALGVVEGRVLVVVYTDRGETRRLISARKADKSEQAVYYSRVYGDGES